MSGGERKISCNYTEIVFGSASIWVIIPVPFYPAIEYFCPENIWVRSIEHGLLYGFGFIDSTF